MTKQELIKRFVLQATDTQNTLNRLQAELSGDQQRQAVETIMKLHLLMDMIYEPDIE